jgi:acyl-CoA thioesterase-1
MTRRSCSFGLALAIIAAGILASPVAPVRRADASQAETDRPVILAVGESTTAGYGVDREDSYPAQLQRELDARGYRYRVVNHGVSGSTTRDALARLDRGMRLLPKIVIIALGGNDGGSRMPGEATRQNMTKLISMFKRVGATVFVTDRNLPTDDPSGSTLFAALAQEHGAVLIPPLLTGVSGHPDLLIADGRHPNADGYRIVVGHLLEHLEPYLIREY